MRFGTFAAAAVCAASLFLALLARPASAAPFTYTGEAPVASQDDDERAAGLRRALAGVLTRQSGDEALLQREDAAAALARAGDLMLQYEYRRNPAGDPPLLLVVQFDGEAVERLLQRLQGGGQPAAAPVTVRVRVAGIAGSDDWLRLAGYLRRHNLVRAVQPESASGDAMVLQLELVTGFDRFLDALAIERILEPQPGPVPAGVDAGFVLAP